MDFSQKVIWITGASSGIGWHLALAFAASGAKVAATARRMEELEKLVSIIHEKGGEAKAFYCDVADEQALKTCADEVYSHFGRIDVAIANAGFGVVGKVEDLPSSDWERQFRINVTGLVLTAKYALPYLRETKGRLVLMGSVAAFVPNPGVGAYGASKAAVHSIGETLQVELLGSGVSCTTIHPGFVDSNITRIDNEGNFHPNRKDPRPAGMMWTTEKAARVILQAIAKREKVFVFTRHGKIAVWLGKFMPSVARKMMAKQLKN